MQDRVIEKCKNSYKYLLFLIKQLHFIKIKETIKYRPQVYESICLIDH